VSEGRGVWTDEVFSTTATKTDGGHLLNGHKRFVVDAANAHSLIVVATDDQGIGFFVVDAAAQGISVTALESMDPTRKLADVQFTDSPAQKLNNSQPEQLRILVDIASTGQRNGRRRANPIRQRLKLYPAALSIWPQHCLFSGH
jgi:hypothetical protein